jgi:hypothetical protein
MAGEWLVLAELAPDAGGYETPAATRLMQRIEEAVHRCGEPDEVARVRLVMAEGHTLLRFETCSSGVWREFQALDGSDPGGDCASRS